MRVGAEQRGVIAPALGRRADRDALHALAASGELAGLGAVGDDEARPAARQPIVDFGGRELRSPPG